MVIKDMSTVIRAVFFLLPIGTTHPFPHIDTQCSESDGEILLPNYNAE